jgi:putative Ca2+/H+ antiporter (TMEM165/GDT1 family)
MDIKIFLTVFATIFLAELGDKTQLATVLFATDKAVSKWVIFAAAALALVATSAIGVLAGGWVSQHVSERLLKFVAGLGFILIGAWILIRAA